MNSQIKGKKKKKQKVGDDVKESHSKGNSCVYSSDGNFSTCIGCIINH